MKSLKLIALLSVLSLYASSCSLPSPAAPKGKRAVKSKPAGPPMEPLKTPLSYNGEFVEVTSANTLRCRYHSYDFKKDLAFYTQRALEESKGRTPGTMKIQEVFIRQIDVVARHKDNPGGKIEGVCNIPESFIAEAPQFEKLFTDFVFASSNGEMKVEFHKPIIVDKPVKYDQPSDGPKNWWFRPKWVEEQLGFLKDYKDHQADFMFFFLHTVKIKGTDKLMWPAYGGMAWGNEEIKGTRLITLNDHELARDVHEWEHHIFDTTIQETEDMTVTRFHGLDDAGYNADALTWGGKLGPCLAYYRDCMRYYYPRDMWERWRLKGKHNTTHEPFGGKDYKWADVKYDYWFKLPKLGKDELHTLTGLKTVEVTTTEASMMFKVDTQEQLLSPRIDKADPQETTLNNACELRYESAAVLKTATGTWLFVKPKLVDVYVDMLKLRKNSTQTLPVYGYVLDGEKALIALKLPDAPLPANEAGFFRAP
jgi:hypothetical protein